MYTSDNESVTKGPFVIDVIVREEFGYGIMRAELDVTWKVYKQLRPLELHCCNYIFYCWFY